MKSIISGIYPDADSEERADEPPDPRLQIGEIWVQAYNGRRWRIANLAPYKRAGKWYYRVIITEDVKEEGVTRTLTEAHLRKRYLPLKLYKERKKRFSQG